LFFFDSHINIYKKYCILNFPKKIMRLTKRDRALTKINIPTAVYSVYFRGKRYLYNDYLKILNQVNKKKNSTDFKENL